jgi:hypothetical protein
MSSNTDDVESDSESPSSEGPDRGHVRGTRGRRHRNRERSKSKKLFYEKWCGGEFMKYYTLLMTIVVMIVFYFVGKNITINVYKNDYCTTSKTEGGENKILENAEDAEDAEDAEEAELAQHQSQGKLTNDKTKQREDSLKAVNEIKSKIRKILTASVSDASGEEKDFQNKVVKLMLYIISETNPDVESSMIKTLNKIISDASKSETSSTNETPSDGFQVRSDMAIVNVLETLMEGTKQDKESESLAIEADSDIVELKMTNFLSSLVSQETNPIAKRKLSLIEVVSILADEINKETKLLTLDLVKAWRAISSSGKLDDSVINTLMTGCD